MRAWPILFALALLASPSKSSAKGFMHWPVERATAKSSYLTQGFYGDYRTYCGAKDGCGTHSGYDYGVGVGTKLYAVAPGVVDAINTVDASTPDYGGAGKWIRVRHDASSVPGLPSTYYVAYLHLSAIYVVAGDTVGTKTVIGLSGNTGGVAPHLHLHTGTAKSYCGAPVDPGCPTPAWVGGSVVPSTFIDAPGCQSVCKPVDILWVQPAAYGNEDYVTATPCGSLDAVGKCEGDILHWCKDGAATSANCADSGRVCGYQDDTIGYNCLRCDQLPTPRCEGARWLRCEGTTAKSTDCAATGETCEPDGCKPPPTSDAGFDDVGTDAFGANVDATPSDDAGTDSFVTDAPSDLASSSELEGSCGCRTTTDSHSSRGLVSLFVGLLLVVRRRR